MFITNPLGLSSAERTREPQQSLIVEVGLPAQVAERRVMTEGAHSFLFLRTKPLGEKGEFVYEIVEPVRRTVG